MKARLLAIEQKSKDLQDFLASNRREAADYLERFEMAWLHHDNALEGVIYTPQEINLALQEDASVSETSLFPAVWEIRNHKAAIDFIRKEAAGARRHAALTMPFVKKLNDLLSGASATAQAARTQMERRERTDKEFAKERDNLDFRRDIPLHKTYLHDITPPNKIASQLEKLLEWTGSSEFREIHPVIQSARVQHQFILIFPFSQMSGKVGRMLSNFVLLRASLFPVVIASVDRSKYYETFRGSFSSFLNLTFDSMENSLDNGIKYFRDQLRAFR